jgi:hypothetical protein
MTPKEKAIEIVNKYMSIRSINLHDHSIIYLLQHKQCALVAVDEIIKATKGYSYVVGYDMLSHDIYWEDVKQEIENL